MSGPYETERQAAGTPEVRVVYARFDTDPGVGKMAPHNEQMLVRACSAAGVQLGAYDRRILAWLAGWEPATCAVVTGLITRAHAAGAAGQGACLGAADAQIVLGALSDAAEYRSNHPDDDDRALIAAYRSLSRALGDDR